MLRSLPQPRLRRWRAVPLIAVAGLLSVAGTANATIYTPADGPALNAAILDANANPGSPHTIRLPNTTISPTATMTITGDVTITGDHSNDDGFGSRPEVSGLAVAPTNVAALTVAAGANVKMSGWSFTPGNVDEGFPLIRNNGTLRLDGMYVGASSSRGIETGNTSTTTVVNTCVCDNSTLGMIGAGNNTIINSTIANNTGGGLQLAGTGSMRNTYLDNLSTGAPRNCFATPPARSGNMATDATCGTGTTPVPDQQIAFLADNGGPTDTNELLPGPAEDAADQAFCPTTDQRFYVRPVGAGCDIGAYEIGAVKDTTAPACPGPGVVIAGPPKQQLITLTDGGSGLGGDAVLLEETTISNGTVAVPPPFASPFRSPGSAPAPSNSGQVVTATKTNQTAPTSWSFTARDWAGNTKLCI